jgi:hypothetical protein
MSLKCHGSFYNQGLIKTAQNQQVKKSVRHNLLIAQAIYQHTFIVSTIFAKIYLTDVTHTRNVFH